MATTSRTRIPQLELFSFKDFSGGWNPRDAPSELGANESPDCLNITLDQRGGVVKRLGLTRLGSGSGLSGAPTNSFYWPTEQLAIVQDGTAVKKTADFITFTTIHTFSTSARVTFADFNGKLIMVHPVDGVFNYTTAGSDANVSTTVKGTCVAVWQNKVWVGGDSSHIARIWWSNPGDETVWTTATDWVDVREVDGTPVVALGAGQTMDVTAKPTLLVFKAFSTHRINDSTTGQYTTLSASDGAASALSVVQIMGKTVFAGSSGIFVTDGVVAPVRVSQKLEPLFNSLQLNYGRLDQWTMGLHGNRAVLSMPRTGSSTNNVTLEYDIEFGWIVPHSFGVSSFMRYAKNDNLCYGTSVSAGKVYQVFASGSDDGAAITARYQTRWLEPNNGHEAQMRRAIIEGRGNFDFYVKKNYTVSDGELNAVQIGGGGFVWGTDVWGDTTTPWGPTVYEDFESFYSLGVARSMSFLMKHTGTSSASAPKLLGDGAAAEVGAFACYAIDLEYVRLGYA